MLHDDEIVAGVLSGSTKHQKDLYEKYKRVLINYIKKHHQNLIFESEDIVSDVLIKIFTNIEKFDAQKYVFKTWCLGILKNHIVDMWRKNKIDVTYYDTTYNVTLSCVNDIENEILNEYFMSLCENASVTKNDHSYLELKYIHGYSYEDISAYTGISATQLSNRISYLKKKIKIKNPHY